MMTDDYTDKHGMDDDPVVPLLAEVAEAAREVSLSDQPPRLRNALAALALTESRVVTSFLEPNPDY